MIDTTPPKLKSLYFPATIDLGKGASKVNFTVEVDDGDGSGVTDVIVWVDKNVTTSIGTYKLFMVNGDILGDTFTDATPHSATSSFTFNTATAPGTYNITSVDVTDLAGNKVSYTPAQLTAMNIKTSFTVTDGIAPVPTKPSTTVSSTLRNGELSLELISSDWIAGASNSISMVVTYDASRAHYDSFSLSGGAAAFSTSITEVGNIGIARIAGSGATAAQVQGALKLALDIDGGSGLVTYAIDALTVNGKVQTLGQANKGSLYLGTDGADRLAQSDGVSLVEGGAGLDTAVYAGKRSDYKVVKDNAGFTLDDGKGNVAILSHVERAVFVDGAIALDVDGVAGQVYRLYQAAFDRQPDLGGVGFWLHAADVGNSLYDIADGFIASDEFVTKVGADASASRFISALYQNILHRTPDQTGFDYWVNALEHGYDRTSTLVQFSESAENIAQIVGNIENGFAYTPFA